AGRASRPPSTTDSGVVSSRPGPESPIGFEVNHPSRRFFGKWAIGPAPPGVWPTRHRGPRRMELRPVMPDLLAPLRNRRLVTLMLGHFTVDGYVGLLPVLYPLLIQRFRLDLQTVGLVTLAYTGMASVSQPLFGLLADRYGTRLTGLTMTWTAVTFASIGFLPTFPALVAMAALSGLGSGAFHPFGALSVRRVLPERGANTAMSVYVTGG